MVVNGDAHKLSGLDELAGDADVFARRLRVARWVVVQTDDRSRVRKQGSLKNGSWLYDGRR